ncbi:acyl-CoA dehydrogenase family protein [Micromonospora sp. M12]
MAASTLRRQRTGLLRADRAGQRLGRAALRTRAVRDGGDWLLTGTKTFITNGTTADVALVFARTGGPGIAGSPRSWCPPTVRG